jgi:geranylgeranyl diphosphate synthase type II
MANAAEFASSCEYLDAVEAVENYLDGHFKKRASEVSGYSPQLLESMRYSLFTPGKRFRPVLCQHTSLGLGGSAALVLPFAAALEMVHAYSLIHDDLPCMDNDDERRGQPTNHKKFGEALALLAGDALLTESFYVIADHYRDVGSALVRLLADNSGMAGMVGGQAMDMGFGETIGGLKSVEKIHRGKTAALIAAATEGAGIVNKVPPEVQGELRELGFILGGCFQIKDDLLDQHQDRSPKSYIHHLGAEKTEKVLSECTQIAREKINALPFKSAHYLLPFLEFNLARTK